MTKFLKILGKILASILLAAVLALAIFSVSPIYRFEGPVPFSGDRIYNPYADLDTSIGWKRACLHTHTRVDKGINECPYYPDVVYSDYMSLLPIPLTRHCTLPDTSTDTISSNSTSTPTAWRKWRNSTTFCLFSCPKSSS